MVVAHHRKRYIMANPGEDLVINLDDLFKDDQTTGTPPVVDETKKLELTAAMSKRINEVKTKTEQETRDKIAKDLGFENFEAMSKAKTKQDITDAGLDPEQVEKIIEPLLEKRLQSDPRMIKLSELEAQEKKAQVKAELDEIEKLTGLKVTEADLSKETLDLVEKGIKLSQAYIATNPTKVMAAGNKSTTAHLAGSTGTGQVKVRNYTAEEKALYKAINPGASDEEINKKVVELK